MDKVQRQILWNQLEILKHLNPDETKEYELQQHTISSGYTMYYSTVLHAASEEEATREMQDETIDILNMFRALSNAMHRGWKPTKPDNAVFRGFDGNNDSHYGFAVYLLDERNLFEESQDCPRNSHSSLTLERYRLMLRGWKGSIDKWQLTDTEADLITT